MRKSVVRVDLSCVIVTIKHLQINDGLRPQIANINIYLDNIALLVGAMLFN